MDKQVQRMFTRMAKNKPEALSWLDRSFLSEHMKSAYKEVLERRYTQVELQ